MAVFSVDTSTDDPIFLVHDGCRDIIHVIFLHLAPLAGFIINQNDVYIEPIGFITDNRSLRPFDNALCLENAQNSTFTWLGTDESTAVDQLKAPADLSVAPTPITVSVEQQHESAEDDKFNGPARHGTRNPLTGRRIIAELIEKRCAFAPTSLDRTWTIRPSLLLYMATNPIPVQA